mmetsp:Transcript_29000/g.93507  ORF Transcript_29000/g.93507 Transcript_29000/m.93507 type:complete len:319 (+) Transcript_29000:886-1842(+)
MPRHGRAPLRSFGAARSSPRLLQRMPPRPRPDGFAPLRRRGFRGLPPRRRRRPPGRPPPPARHLGRLRGLDRRRDRLLPRRRRPRRYTKPHGRRRRRQHRGRRRPRRRVAPPAGGPRQGRPHLPTRLFSVALLEQPPLFRKGLRRQVLGVLQEEQEEEGARKFVFFEWRRRSNAVVVVGVERVVGVVVGVVVFVFRIRRSGQHLQQVAPRGRLKVPPRPGRRRRRRRTRVSDVAPAGKFADGPVEDAPGRGSSSSCCEWWWWSKEEASFRRRRRFEVPAAAVGERRSALRGRRVRAAPGERFDVRRPPRAGNPYERRR